MRRSIITTAVLVFVVGARPVRAQPATVDCKEDGVHRIIEFDKVSLQYSGTAFSGTVNSIFALSSRLTVRPQTLQVAAEATQQWDVFLRGLVAGYNRCAIAKAQYNEGILKIYPRMKQDALGLEQIRKMLESGRKADEIQLQKLLTDFLAQFRRFAGLAEKEQVLDRITNLVHGSQKQIIEAIKSGNQGLANQLSDVAKQISVLQSDLEGIPKPIDVQAALDRRKPLNDGTEVDRQLTAWTAIARKEYETSYDLLQQFRFAEALPHIQAAYDSVRLPEFALALAMACRPLLYTEKAERVLRLAVDDAASIQDEGVEARIRSMLSRVLRDLGKLAEARSQSELAVEIGMRVYGPKSLEVARAENDLGMIFYSLGNFGAALDHVQKAQGIEKMFDRAPLDDLATVDGNLGLILMELGRMAEAESNLREALRLDTKAFGPNSTAVAGDANNLSTLLREESDLSSAERFAQRALAIDKDNLGPNHPASAIDHITLSEALRLQGRVDEAKVHLLAAIRIYSDSFGAGDSRTLQWTEVFNTLYGK
jgi:tetratricopeptide (TPR) repeat protein